MQGEQCLFIVSPCMPIYNSILQQNEQVLLQFYKLVDKISKLFPLRKVQTKVIPDNLTQTLLPAFYSVCYAQYIYKGIKTTFFFCNIPAIYN